MIPSILTAFSVFFLSVAIARRKTVALIGLVATRPEGVDAQGVTGLGGFLAVLGRTRSARIFGPTNRLRDRWDQAGQPGSFETTLGARLLLASVAALVGLAAVFFLRPLIL